MVLWLINKFPWLKKLPFIKELPPKKCASRQENGEACGHEAWLGSRYCGRHQGKVSWILEIVGSLIIAGLGYCASEMKERVLPSEQTRLFRELKSETTDVIGYVRNLQTSHRALMARAEQGGEDLRKKAEFGKFSGRALVEISLTNQALRALAEDLSHWSTNLPGVQFSRNHKEARNYEWEYNSNNVTRVLTNYAKYSNVFDFFVHPRISFSISQWYTNPWAHPPESWGYAKPGVTTPDRTILYNCKTNPNSMFVSWVYEFKDTQKGVLQNISVPDLYSGKFQFLVRLPARSEDDPLQQMILSDTRLDWARVDVSQRQPFTKRETITHYRNVGFSNSWNAILSETNSMRSIDL